jgi:hypothetical protein
MERSRPAIQGPVGRADTASVEDQGLTCAECGLSVDPDLSYIMSVPVGHEPLYHHPACIGLDTL